MEGQLPCHAGDRFSFFSSICPGKIKKNKKRADLVSSYIKCCGGWTLVELVSILFPSQEVDMKKKTIW